MKAIIQNINEITDSREMLEAKPHPFVSVFIYLLILIIAASLVWSYFGEIDDYVKANGVVRPNEKISSIRNKVNGIIEEVNFEEGKSVKKGDILYKVEHKSLDLQKAATVNELNRLRQEYDNLKKFKQCIMDGKNYFDSKVESEKAFYNRYLKFVTDMEVQSKQVELDSGNLQKIKETLSNLNLLKQSVLQNKSLFLDTDNLYYRQYNDYILSVEKLENNINERKEAFNNAKSLHQSGATSKKELDDAEKLIKSAELDLEKYKNEFMLNINTKIDENNRSLRNLEVSLKGSEYELGEGEGSNEVSVQKYKMDTLVQTDSDILSLENGIKEQENTLKNLEINIKDCTVTAPIDGIVNVAYDVNEGDLLQSGVEVATIVPETNSKYKVQLYVSNADIANIKEGQKIKYHFLALPYREYGELTGIIENIATDAKVDQEKGMSYYMVEAAIENRPLYSYKGVKAEIKVGMACEAQVVTRSKKILYYLLEKLNLKD